MIKNLGILCNFIIKSIKEYFLIILLLSILALILEFFVLNSPTHDSRVNFLNILINVLISATSVFIFIESAIAYRNHIKFINIKDQCYKSLNKFSEFFVKDVIDRFLEHKKTPGDIYDEKLNNDLQKFMNRQNVSNNYFVNSNNYPDSDFYSICGKEYSSRDYNFKNIEGVFVNYILEFDKDNSNLVNTLFSLIRSMLEFEINVGYAERFSVKDYGSYTESFNQIIEECVNIYNITKELLN